MSLPSASVDWEVELVAVIGVGGRDIAQSQAWSCVAGLTLGQDLSERDEQRRGPAPQFSMAKSHAEFSPIGPAVVTTEEFADLGDIALGCAINGEIVQQGTTKDLLFSIPELIAHLSSIVHLYPGDLIFTGTPPGVGMGRTPPRYLQAGETLTSWATGIGEMSHQLQSAKASASSRADIDAMARP